MQNRMSFYRDIHKGLRALLLDLNGKAGRLDFADARATEQFRADARTAFWLLSGHAHHETKFIGPLVLEHAPQLAHMVGPTHDDQEVVIEELTRDLEKLDHDWVVRLSHFTGELFLHMAEEEQQIMPALWAKLTDEELIPVEQALVGSIPPEKVAVYFSWMLPAMSTPNRVELLAGARAGAPPEVYAFLRDLARGVLSPADDAALEDALQEPIAAHS